MTGRLWLDVVVGLAIAGAFLWVAERSPLLGRIAEISSDLWWTAWLVLAAIGLVLLVLALAT